MGFDENGKPKFIDKQDKASFEKLLSFYKMKGEKKFLMTISIPNMDMATEKQSKLWNVIKNLIHAESGNDLDTIESTLNKTKKSVKEMTKKEFYDLLEYSLSICKEFFDVEIVLNKFNNFEVKHKYNK